MTAPPLNNDPTIQSGSETNQDFRGVRIRRIFAFLIDYLLIGLLTLPVAVLVALLGVFTFGLGWFLFAILAPVTALTYIALTLGGRKQATPGMRLADIHLERQDGGEVDPLLAIVHTVLFWAGNAILTPLILLATFVLDQKRTLHDLLIGTVVKRGSSIKNS